MLRRKPTLPYNSLWFPQHACKQREVGHRDAWTQIQDGAPCDLDRKFRVQPSSGDMNAELLTQKECSPASVTHTSSQLWPRPSTAVPGTAELQLCQKPGDSETKELSSKPTDGNQGQQRKEAGCWPVAGSSSCSRRTYSEAGGLRVFRSVCWNPRAWRCHAHGMLVHDPQRATAQARLTPKAIQHSQCRRHWVDSNARSATYCLSVCPWATCVTISPKVKTAEPIPEGCEYMKTYKVPGTR